MTRKVKQPLGCINKVRLYLICLVFSLGIQLAESAEIETEKQRNHFLHVEKLIKSKQFTRAKTEMGQLRNYALYPYLEALFIQQNLSLANESVIEEFLSEYNQQPVTLSLRRSWLKYLARNQERALYLKYYQGSTEAELQCKYLQFMWETTDNLDALWPQVRKQWVQGRSQPKSCDSVFQAWIDAGHRTEQHVWERIKLAVEAKQTGLTLYLIRLLPEEAKYLGHLLRRISANPMVLMQFDQLRNQDSRELEILVPGLKRLIWRDTKQAIRAIAHYEQAFGFSTELKNDLYQSVGITLAVRNEPKALDWFDKVPVNQLTDTGKHWLLATLLRAESYDRVVMLSNALDKSVGDKEQWLYWRGRSLVELGFIKEGKALLRQVATHRSYYGFLASARVGLEPQLSHESLVVNPKEIEALKAQPSIQRAIELFALERNLEARREWNILAYRGTYEEQKLSALIAYEQQRFEQAIYGFARTGVLNDIERRFPMAFKDLVLNFSDENEIDPAWVYAIVRRESSFDREAVSPVGARGLMQVMPDTANYLINQSPSWRKKRITPNRLFIPEENIQLGTRYMKELLNRTSDNWVIATAAYNAGINRVIEWLPEQPMDFDIWVETVPYQETRDYVKNVLAYQQVYTVLLGKDENVLAPLVSLKMIADYSS